MKGPGRVLHAKGRANPKALSGNFHGCGQSEDAGVRKRGRAGPT